MRFPHVMIGADHAALKDLEEVFGGFPVLRAACEAMQVSTFIAPAQTVNPAANAGVDR